MWDWSETSQTVSLFCRGHGVVRGLAKGSKRDDARFSGGFELFTRGQVGLILKSSEAMANLTAWDLSNIYPGARASLPAFYCSMAMLDLVHHMVRDHDPHPALFDALAMGASELSADRPVAGALARFLWNVLVEAGFHPELRRDVRSGQPLNDCGPLTFDPRLGGFTHSNVGAAEEGWRVRPRTLAILRSFAAGPTGDQTADDLLRSAKLLYAYVRETAGNPIESVEAAFQMMSSS